MNQHQSWRIRPHGQLEPVTSSVYTVTGALRMPLTTLERRMTIVKLEDRRLIIYSAVALAEPQMRELEALGTPAFLVVPSHLHRLDVAAWKQRYPDACVVAPSGSRAKVEQVVRVDTTNPDFGSAAVRFVELEGTNGMEAALEVEDEGTITLVLNDIVGNLPPSHGLVLRALGFAGNQPRVPRAIKRVLVKDPAALRARFEQWAKLPVRCLLVSHGAPVRERANQVLLELARSLRDAR
jgi:hypothetical protein